MTTQPLTPLEETCIETIKWIYDNMGKTAEYDLHVIATTEEAGMEFVQKMEKLSDAIRERIDELKRSEEDTSKNTIGHSTKEDKEVEGSGSSSVFTD